MQWREELVSNTALNRATLARREGLSRARVTQIMHLLELPSEIQNHLLQLSDDRYSSVFTERKLQSFVHLQERQKQLAAFRELLQSPNQERFVDGDSDQKWTKIERFGVVCRLDLGSACSQILVHLDHF